MRSCCFYNIYRRFQQKPLASIESWYFRCFTQYGSFVSPEARRCCSLVADLTTPRVTNDAPSPLRICRVTDNMGEGI